MKLSAQLKQSVRALAVAGVASASLIAATVDAKTFRWASQGDVLTMDPHSQNEGLNNTMSDHVYEPLVTRGKTMALEPCLAVSWTQVNPTTLRLKLRDKVTFHNGAPFSADDVVFSITRALEKTSDFSAYMQGIKEAKKIDNLTVEIITNGPNPTLLDQLTEVRMMNREWAVKFNALKPQDYKNKEETYTARNANGTGAFVLKAREPDVKTVLVANSNWWGKREGDVNEVVYTPIKQDATRVSALISGEIDLVLDPPVQDIGKLKENKSLKILEGNENRTIFLNYDQGRNELLYSSVKGKNPFKDIRVRQAMAHAIDANAIRVSVMRGLATTSMSMIAPQVRGYTKDVEKRWPLDLAKAKKLMAEAGYPNGFEVTLDCPNNRYINDEKICVAISGMLAKIDIKIKLNSMPRATYFPKIQTNDTSMYLLGWGVPTFDSLYTLQSILRTKGAGGDGNWNFSGYSNPKLDAIVDQLKTEIDFKKRADLTRDALLLDQADVGHIPLHHQVIPWAMRSNVTVVHRPDNRMHAKWAVVK
ncbi:MAG: ABC transporter substrate-binding protein [Betaproteobacteria bacterium]|nr:ABC transporter substrate-binding protein [Betaproteobacteria bacterium]